MTFTEVPVVAVGEKVKASHMAALSKAIEDRILSGLGSPVERVGFLLHSVVRQILADGEISAYPEDEFWTNRMMRDSEDDPWVVESPGDPGGPNIACHSNALIHGAEIINLASERLRLNDIPTVIGGTGDPTPINLWALANAQAGVFDLATGDYVSPVFDGALAYAYIRSASWSPHGNSFGGYLPSPELGPDCDIPADGSVTPKNFLYVFTRISGVPEGETIVFSGSCPENPDGVAGIAHAPFAYFVFMNNGTIFYLPKTQWIEGPYTGQARLGKQGVDVLSRAQVEFAAAFRGTAEQRGDNQRTIKHAFRLREFGERQYALAPRAGVYEGAEIVPISPTWSETGSGTITDGTPLSFDGGGTTFSWPDGTVCHGILAHADALAGPATLVLLQGSTAIATVTLTPDGMGHAEALLIFGEANKLTTCGVKAVGDIIFSGSGQITLEASALLPYKPLLHDYMLVTRLASWDGSLTTVDGQGITCDQAREISDTLLNSGVILALTPPPDPLPGGDQPNPFNGFYQSLRRYLQCFRVVRDPQLVDYELELGNSVLTFKRGGNNDDTNDLFAGIGPALNPILTGGIVWGRRYIVSGASITYNGSTVAANTFFTGVKGQKDFTGSGTVREVDGIRSTAEPASFTNEWVVDAEANPYSSNPVSIWHVEDYTRAVSPFNKRGGVYSPGIAYDKNVNLHISYGVAGKPITAEMMRDALYWKTPLAAPHADRVNEWNCDETDTVCTDKRKAFYRSNRVVEPPLKITSATRVVVNGSECVRLVLNGRLHHHHSLAQTSIPSARFLANDSTFRTAIRAEAQDYRTVENAICEWLIRDVHGTECDYTGQGNSSAQGDLYSDPDAPNGSCCPIFRFLKLMPKPVLDDNDSLDATDSPALCEILRYSDLLLRGICEGYLDGETTLQLACKMEQETVYQFTYTNLMFYANANRWPEWFPTALRPDNPFSHGPMPNCRKYAQDFNNQARAWNLLTDVPLFIPTTLQSREGDATGNEDVTGLVLNARGEYAAATSAWSYGQGDYAVYLNSGFGSAGSYTYGAWTDVPPLGTLSAGNSWQISVDRFASPFTANKRSDSLIMQYRWAGLDDSELALTDDVVEMLTLTPGLIVRRSSYRHLVAHDTIAGQTTGQQCHQPAAGADTVWSAGPVPNYSNVFDVTQPDDETVCLKLTNGILSAPDAPSGIAWYCSDGNPGAFPDSPCKDYPYNSYAWTVVNTDTPIVSVPLAAYTGGS